MTGAYFFVLLDDAPDDRCKLQIDIPDAAGSNSAEAPPSVGAIRTALRRELGWRAAEIVLYAASTNHAETSFENIETNHCVKLIDDEAPLKTCVVFVKRRQTRVIANSAAVPPAAVNDASSPREISPQRIVPKRRAISSSNANYSEEDETPMMRGGSSRKSRRTNCKSDSPHGGIDDGGNGGSSGNSGGRHYYNGDGFPMNGGGQDNYHPRPPPTPAGGYQNDYYRNGYQNEGNPYSRQRPPSPPERGRYVSAASSQVLVPPPPPPPAPNRRSLVRSSSSSIRNNDDSRRRPVEMFERRRCDPWPPLPPAANSNIWNFNSRKMELTRYSKYRTQGGRYPQSCQDSGGAWRPASRPRAPVVHNLISKQQFMHELHALVAKTYESRGRTLLPYRIDSLGDICITHDVKVPSTYLWDNIKSAPEFLTLSTPNRRILERSSAVSNSAARSMSPPLGNPDRRRSCDDPPTVKEYETTVCFVEVGQERLLVFDWYVYTLEAVAEYRDRVTANDLRTIFYIYGQPRIGKSICTLFLAVAAAFIGETIFYFCDSRVWEVSPNGVVRWTIPELKRCPPPSKDTTRRRFLFAELRIREQEELLSDLKDIADHLQLVIIASAVPESGLIEERRFDKRSPEKQSNSNSVRKTHASNRLHQQPPRDLPLIFVPPPAWHELCALKILSYPSISKQEFEFRYFLFGPVPRNIISEAGPFDYVIDSWCQQASSIPPSSIAAFPHALPAPDLLDGEPPKLTTLLLPVEGREGIPTVGTTKHVTLTFVSAAAETVVLSEGQRLAGL